MGCMSSKVVMARTSSYSYRGDDHHPRPLLDHLLIGTATPANHHLLHLLSPPDTSTLHLPSHGRNVGYLGNQESGDTKHTIDALQLMADLDPDPPSPNITMDDVVANSKEYGRRSKSCQRSPHDRTSSKYEEFGFGENMGTIGRCKSFHTVEEYDALLQRIWVPKPEAKDDGDLLGVPSTNFNRVTMDSPAKKDGDEMKSEETIRRDDERGMKRKKIGEGLAGSLQMGNIEFQTVGSLRQWLDVHVYSPGVGGAATPKFGSCNNNNNHTQVAPGEDSVLVETGKQQGEEEEEESIIELAAAFEEYMQRLQVEEENILKQIEANLHIHDSQATWNGHA